MGAGHFAVRLSGDFGSVARFWFDSINCGSGLAREEALKNTAAFKQKKRPALLRAFLLCGAS